MDPNGHLALPHCLAGWKHPPCPIALRISLMHCDIPNALQTLMDVWPYLIAWQMDNICLAPLHWGYPISPMHWRPKWTSGLTSLLGRLTASALSHSNVISLMHCRPSWTSGLTSLPGRWTASAFPHCTGDIPNALWYPQCIADLNGRLALPHCLVDGQHPPCPIALWYPQCTGISPMHWDIPSALQT